MVNLQVPRGGANQIRLISNLLWHHKLAPSRIKCHAEHFFSQKGKINTPYFAATKRYKERGIHMEVEEAPIWIK